MAGKRNKSAARRAPVPRRIAEKTLLALIPYVLPMTTGVAGTAALTIPTTSVTSAPLYNSYSTVFQSLRVRELQWTYLPVRGRSSSVGALTGSGLGVVTVFNSDLTVPLAFTSVVTCMQLADWTPMLVGKSCHKIWKARFADDFLYDPVSAYTVPKGGVASFIQSADISTTVGQVLLVFVTEFTRT